MSKVDIDWVRLVKGVCANDQGLTNEFVESAQKPLLQFCLYLTGNKPLAEDICHDALIKALTVMEQLKNQQQVMAWLKQIARRLFLDYCKAASQSKAHLDINDMDDSVELSLDNNANEAQILAMQALQSLSEEDRSLVILVDIEGYSYSEAGETLKMNEGTVKSRIFRAREKMSFFLGTKRGAQSS